MIRLAKVESVSPIRVTLDGDDTPVPVEVCAVHSSRLAPGARVLCDSQDMAGSTRIALLHTLPGDPAPAPETPPRGVEWFWGDRANYGPWAIPANGTWVTPPGATPSTAPEYREGWLWRYVANVPVSSNGGAVVAVDVRLVRGDGLVLQESSIRTSVRTPLALERVYRQTGAVSGLPYVQVRSATSNAIVYGSGCSPWAAYHPVSR